MKRHRHAINEPGHAHELTFSCYRKYPFLKAERTCLWLAAAIDGARDRLDFDVWAYVFMPDHAHMIVRPRSHPYDVAAILREVKHPVARLALAYLRGHAPAWLDRLAVRKGGRVRHQFWQKGGGYDRNLTEPATLLAACDYIHRNPVRRGLVERARDYRWSSAAWHEDMGPTPVRIDSIPWSWADP